MKFPAHWKWEQTSIKYFPCKFIFAVFQCVSVSLPMYASLPFLMYVCLCPTLYQQNPIFNENYAHSGCSFHLAIWTKSAPTVRKIWFIDFDLQDVDFLFDCDFNLYSSSYQNDPVWKLKLSQTVSKSKFNRTIANGNQNGIKNLNSIPKR